MSVIYSLIFDLITEPLGLPIDWYKEYLIMLIVGIIAYEFASDFVGKAYARGV